MDLILTAGDAFELGGGTRRFGQQLLRDVGLRGAVSGCEVTPCRTRYFSDSLEGGWEDRWQRVWRVAIQLETAAEGELRTGMIDTEAFDADSGGEAGGDHCLLVLDFPSLDDRRRAQGEVARAVPEAAIFHTLALGRFPQLQIDLGPRTIDFFSSGARDAERLLARLGKNGSDQHAWTFEWTIDDQHEELPMSKTTKPAFEHELVAGCYLLRHGGELLGQLEYEADNHAWVLEPSSGDTQEWPDLKKRDSAQALARATEFLSELAARARAAERRKR